MVPHNEILWSHICDNLPENVVKAGSFQNESGILLFNAKLIYTSVIIE
jgi:hypothetical protein